MAHNITDRFIFKNKFYYTYEKKIGLNGSISELYILYLEIHYFTFLPLLLPLTDL